jgi:3-methyladenine DNA glycosylase/8-oxoguanine DNA glycosylase
MMLTFSVASDFSLLRTVHSHGWSVLPPFSVQKNPFRLQRIVSLSSRKHVLAEIHQPSASRLQMDILSTTALSSGERKKLIAQMKSCFRLDEDFSEFYRQAKRYTAFRWIPKMGAGRMLRSPTVFEDVVKMICTTNCSWALTEIMTKNFCEKLGSKINGAGFAFPVPEAIADRTEKYLRKEIRAGYRSPYLLELSRRIAKGELNIESWRTSTLPTTELFDEVRSVKGIGPYAAGNILKLLGRYDYLGIDSWCRKQFRERHKNGRTTSDRVIEKFYAPFGTWRGLFFWMDVTKHWYDHEFPLNPQ